MCAGSNDLAAWHGSVDRQTALLASHLADAAAVLLLAWQQSITALPLARRRLSILLVSGLCFKRRSKQDRGGETPRLACWMDPEGRGACVFWVPSQPVSGSARNPLAAAAAMRGRPRGLAKDGAATCTSPVAAVRSWSPSSIIIISHTGSVPAGASAASPPDRWPGRVRCVESREHPWKERNALLPGKGPS